MLAAEALEDEDTMWCSFSSATAALSEARSSQTGTSPVVDYRLPDKCGLEVLQGFQHSPAGAGGDRHRRGSVPSRFRGPQNGRKTTTSSRPGAMGRTGARRGSSPPPGAPDWADRRAQRQAREAAVHALTGLLTRHRLGDVWA